MHLQRHEHLRQILLIFLTTLLIGCGFHFQGAMQLAPQLHHMYLKTPDPYGTLSRSLQQYLKMSNVRFASSPATATTILDILQDNTSEELLSVSSTQQTRQYNLRVTVLFTISDAKGRIIVPAQVVTETRVITVQSDQVLGRSNEANLYYQQMRRSIAYAIMNRITSHQITQLIMDAFNYDET